MVLVVFIIYFFVYMYGLIDFYFYNQKMVKVDVLRVVFCKIVFFVVVKVVM